MNATPKQLQHIHAALHMKGLLQHKREMVNSYTNGRTESSRDMTFEEAADMLRWLNDYKTGDEQKQPMIRKLIAMAREMGVVSRESVVDIQGAIKEKSNYMQLNKWMLERSYLKKKLNDYKYEELPKLVSQYQAVYQSWLKKIK